MLDAIVNRLIFLQTFGPRQPSSVPSAAVVPPPRSSSSPNNSRDRDGLRVSSGPRGSKPRVSPTSSSTLTAIAAVLNSLSSVPVPSSLSTNSRVRSRPCLLVPSFLC